MTDPRLRDAAERLARIGRASTVSLRDIEAGRVHIPAIPHRIGAPTMNDTSITDEYAPALTILQRVSAASPSERPFDSLQALLADGATLLDGSPDDVSGIDLGQITVREMPVVLLALEQAAHEHEHRARTTRETLNRIRDRLHNVARIGDPTVNTGTEPRLGRRDETLPVASR